MDWTDEVIERLRALWAEGHSTAEIGRRMGVSKNAVVGKAHRLALPPRPSPIRRGAGDRPSRPAAPRRSTGPTLPSLGTGVALATAVSASADVSRNPGLSASSPVRPVAAPRSSLLHGSSDGIELGSLGRSVGRSGGGRRIACCWPIGEPGTSSFHFCDQQSVAGKPYCAAHASLAYVKIRDRREEAA